MRILSLSGRAGASGDMLLAALLAVGADRDALAPVEDTLDVRYEVGERVEQGISATKVDVLLTTADTEGEEASNGPEHSDGQANAHHYQQTTDPGQPHDRDHGHAHDNDQRREHDQEHGHDNVQGREHDQENGHDNGQGHEHDKGHTHAEGHGPTRTYDEVITVVESMDLPEEVEADALTVFELLGEAEAGVHGTDLSETHFHEVGADDAIADIVGVCLLLDDLDVDRVVMTPVSVGGGEVSFSHGTYPVPVPAVVELAERADWAVVGGPVDCELLTPTGAALLAHHADGVERLPPMRVAHSGYGAGSIDLGDRPNVLRATVGDAQGRLRQDDIAIMETNLDDATPEVLGDLQRSLADADARDVTIVPTTMKKARPGHLVKVIAKPADAERVARRLAEETGTLGVRETGASHRWVAERHFETATLELDAESYEVTVKVATDSEGEVIDVSAEYDDAAAVADATGRPLRDVMQRAEAQIRD